MVTEVRPGSVAATAGIEPGTVILQVNCKSVNNATEFERAIEESSASRRVLLLLREDNVQRSLVMSW